MELERQLKNKTEYICQLLGTIFKNMTSNTIGAGTFPFLYTPEKFQDPIPVKVPTVLLGNSIFKNWQLLAKIMEAVALF